MDADRELDFDEEEFRRYLAGAVGIASDKARYYVGWAKRFLARYGTAGEVRQENEEKFRRILEKEFEPWQVRQALHSVRCLRDFVASRRKARQRALREHDELIAEYTRLLRLQHKSYRTEQSYVAWVRRFLAHAGQADRSSIAEPHLRSFLTYLAVEKRVSAATQQQAFNAVLFLFRNMLRKPVVSVAQAIRSRKPKRLPVVLSRGEVRRLIEALPEPYALMAKLIYGGGLRLRECVGLRIQDIDLENSLLLVRSGKGNKDRTTLLPRSLHEELRRRMQVVRRIYDRDRLDNNPGVPLPEALEQKMPNAGSSWSWFWLFPWESARKVTPGRHS